MAQTSQQEQEEEIHSTSAEEYAMIRAVLARISGLRLLMIGCAIIAGIVAVVVYFYELVILTVAGNANVLSVSLSYSIFSALPFMAAIGFLSYRVNRHIRRLSRGRYLPPVEEDY